MYSVIMLPVSPALKAIVKPNTSTSVFPNNKLNQATSLLSYKSHVSKTDQGSDVVLDGLNQLNKLFIE